jgi:hypothetical protein
MTKIAMMFPVAPEHGGLKIMESMAKPADFFISYTGNDKAWAEGIAWTLEEAGYQTVI